MRDCRTDWPNAASQNAFAPVFGGGRFTQPGADGGDTRDASPIGAAEYRRRRHALQFLLTGYASAASSSASFSPSPAMIASATMPEFWRTCASILAAMSGFCLRKTLAFSRPCPMRWLS